ncbi:MAG: hypothetical protein NTX61_03335 [Bacteroidetes bacterium]|nr:hypothetical protein [Bacteroidota bacterium]
MVVKSQYVQKVTSINYYGINGLNPSNLTVFNEKLYFFGTDDQQYVDKLMVTPDGSAAGGTSSIAPIKVGSPNFVVLNNKHEELFRSSHADVMKNLGKDKRKKVKVGSFQFPV